MLPTLITHKFVWSILLVIWSADYWGRSNIRTSILPEPAAYDHPTTGITKCKVAYALPLLNLQRERNRGCKTEIYLNLFLTWIYLIPRLSFIFVYVYAIVLVYYVYIYVIVFNILFLKLSPSILAYHTMLKHVKLCRNIKTF